MTAKSNSLQHSNFAHNIKLLRKKFGYSQEVLAQKLGIKRSSIAVYESKNVEPRLRIILEMAKIFDIDIQTLIEDKLVEDEPYPSLESNKSDQIDTSASDLKSIHDIEVSEFIEKSVKIKKVLEGFKAFYAFKKEHIDTSSPTTEKLTFDIENFLELMDHLLTYNESVIKAITNARTKEFSES